jgi:hypothetical protein
MEGSYLDDAVDKQRVFQNYLIENRIFMNDELREKFSAVQQLLMSALTKYGVGKNHDQNMVQQAWAEMSTVEPKVQDVEKAVQKRLRYEEA